MNVAVQMEMESAPVTEVVQPPPPPPPSTSSASLLSAVMVPALIAIGVALLTCAGMNPEKEGAQPLDPPVPEALPYVVVHPLGVAVRHSPCYDDTAVDAPRCVLEA